MVRKEMLGVLASIARQHRLSDLARHLGKPDQAYLCHGYHLQLPWLRLSYQDVNRAIPFVIASRPLYDSGA